jgi:hypothetical protein
VSWRAAIPNAHREFRFRAESEEDKVNWLSALNKAGAKTV